MLRRDVCRGAQDKHSRVHGSNSYRESDHHSAIVIRVDLSWTAAVRLSLETQRVFWSSDTGNTFVGLFSASVF